MEATAPFFPWFKNGRHLFLKLQKLVADTIAKILMSQTQI